MIQQTATVLWNRPMGPECYRMGLAYGQACASAVPGQFVMVQTASTLVPLLRRPFSIFGRIGPPEHPDGIELLYKALGPGTRQMARMAQGTPIDILGPLGRGFTVDTAARRIYLAAGGMGVAPIRFLAVHLRALGVLPADCRLLLGGRSQEDLLCRQDFLDLDIPVTVTTDDGSDGDQCLITDPLEEAIKSQAPDRLYACGPHGMLLCVAGIAARYQVPCQVSMETMMACGIGACLGCAVPSADPQSGYRHVCVDGPVFDVRQIRWHAP